MPIDFEVTMNEYLPLRDVVFNTLRRAILRGELKARRAADGDTACKQTGSEQNADPGSESESWNWKDLCS